MSDKAKIIKWASDCLVSKGLKIEHPPEIVIETPWSTVIRFSTSNGCFYLKQTPVDLFIEPKIIKAIQKNISGSRTPTILLKNNELNCFIMKSCGDYSLRTLFNGTISADLLIKGLRSYIRILRSFDENLDAFDEMSLPDWRLHQIPQLYVELLEKKTLLIDEGITQSELDKLMELVNTIKSICKFLSEQKVTNTLVNCDFNENNMIVNEKTQQIFIVDWGECVITHPFFSIASHLQSIARRYKLELNGPFLEKIKQQCLYGWLDVANMNELEIIYQNILRLHPIFCSLALYRLQAATGNKSKEMQNWFIAQFLRTLISNEREGALLLR